MSESPFSVAVQPDWEAFVRCIRREGTPDRVHFIELFLDGEVQDALCQRYAVGEGLDPADPFAPLRRHVALQRFLGYDYVRCGLDGLQMPLKTAPVEDTAALARAGGRAYMEEHEGPITGWDSFEAYPWPDPAAPSTASLEWYEENLPDDMCVIGSGGFGHFCEYLCWLMGYETLCYALYDQRDLVAAISRRLTELFRVCVPRMLQFERVKAIWGTDDMGFRTGTLISPKDLREFVLPGHRLMAEMAHAAGRPYLLHSCGNLSAIMGDLIQEVGIDAKHSFEDTIEDVVETKRRYGSRIALLGGIDVDFLCRAGEGEVRRRVRRSLEACMPGGGFCLGSGNTVANYVPIDNYLAMLDEGRRFAC
ncbi:MAG: uroporphyrinogen decarboxylase family protein [Planctomycetota bacterium]